ncbi:MAG TPA: SDR family NAD(P)-dependent oxidoreductase, partial [Kribbella sp.]
MGALDLTGRKALVTGGAQGLGEGMAKALAAAGAKVVVSDVQKDLGAAVADALDETYGAGNGFVAHDITDDGDWENAVVAANDILGGLDILVNNAGVEITSLVVDLDPGDLRRMLDVNVVGSALGMKHGLRAMRPGGPAGHGGSIVN